MKVEELNNSDLLNNKKSEVYFFESFSILRITRDNWISRIVIIILSTVLGIVGLKVNTVGMMKEAVSSVLNVELAILGIVFTGYALFQALLNDELLNVLIEVDGNDSQSKLYSTNKLFLHLMLQYLLGIFISTSSQIILNVISEDFYLWRSKMANNVLAWSLMFCFFSHFMIIMWRLVAFVSNMFRYFNLHAVTKYLSNHKENRDE